MTSGITTSGFATAFLVLFALVAWRFRTLYIVIFRPFSYLLIYLYIYLLITTITIITT